MKKKTEKKPEKKPPNEKRKKKVKPKSLATDLERITVVPEVAMPSPLASGSLQTLGRDISQIFTVPEAATMSSGLSPNFSFDSVKNQHILTKEIEQTTVIPEMLTSGLTGDSEPLMAFLNEKFFELDIQIKSTSALMRQGLAVARQTSKNMEKYFRDHDVDFIDELDMSIPVKNSAELQDLDMRCQNIEFRRYFVSNL